MGFFTSSKKANGAASAQDAALVQALNMAHGIVWFDLSATVIDANPKFCDMLGVGRDTVLAKPHDSFLDASVTDDLRASQLFATLKAGNPVAATVKWRIPGGDQLWIQSSYLPIKEASGEVCKIALIATDVTAANSAGCGHRRRAITKGVNPDRIPTGQLALVLRRPRTPLRRGVLVEHRHQRSGDASRVGVLDNVAPVDDAGCSLRQYRVGAFE